MSSLLLRQPHLLAFWPGLALHTVQKAACLCAPFLRPSSPVSPQDQSAQEGGHVSNLGFPTL